MKKIIIKILGFWFIFLSRKKTFYSLNNFIFIKSLRALEYGNGGDPSTSGEMNIVSLLKHHFKNPIIFDCGANKGQWAKLFIEKMKKDNFQLFCFEPSKSAFNELSLTLKNRPDIKLFPLAVGNENGSATLYTDQDASKYASLEKLNIYYNNIYHNKEEEIQVVKLDSFCSDNKIDNITYLKLDIEGYEYKALLGAWQMIEQQKIDIIQFEFGKTNIDVKVFFKDFYQLLNKYYKFYRLMSWGIEPMPDQYLESYEIFYCCNYIAISKNIKSNLLF